MKTVLNSSKMHPFTHKTTKGARCFLVPTHYVALVSNKTRKDCELAQGVLQTTVNIGSTHAKVFIEGVGVTTMNRKNLKVA